MSSDIASKADENSLQQIQNRLEQLSVDELEEVQTIVATKLKQRNDEIDLNDEESVSLVNGQWIKWRDLSAHPNLKAVKPWILRVTGTHDKYGVEGDWLDKQKIDGKYHMDISTLDDGDIIRVSGASHSNKKHRYYRVLTVTEDRLYYESGVDEATVIEEVG